MPSDFSPFAVRMRNRGAIVRQTMKRAFISLCVLPLLNPAVARAGEPDPVRAGLAGLGVDRESEIVVGENPAVVEKTAAGELRKFLGQRGVNARIVQESQARGSGRFFLGRDLNLKDIKRWGDAGKLTIRDVSGEDDGFQVKRIGGDIVIAGANPRGVLYGVYAFEEFVEAGGAEKLDLKKVPYFRKRGSGLYFTDIFFNPDLMEDFPEEKAAYLSRLGVNQLTDQGIGGNLADFVTSDVFPFQKPPRADFQRRVKAMSAICQKYGIDQYIFLNEPALPKITAALEKYPDEALGTVKRPWGGDKEGIDRTLCVNSPIVQENLRGMMRKFVREYPDVKGVQLYNMDVSAWLCTPALCERCRAACPDSPPEEFNPWETQAKLVTLLAAAAREESATFDFRFWGAVHYHGDRFDKMIRAAQGYGSLLASWTGSDRTIMVPTDAERDSTCVVSQQICAERSIPFSIAAEFNNLEVIPKSLPFPFHVSAAIKRYRQWGAKSLTEIYGMVPEHNSINALVTQEFQWNPDQDPEVYLPKLARLQFGERAGILMYDAWGEMRKAFDVWNAVRRGPFPLEGSQFHVKMGTAIGGLPPPILPDVVQYYDSVIKVFSDVEPWLAGGYGEHKSPAFLERMNTMNQHLATAAGKAKAAVAAASDQELVGRFNYRGKQKRPTCREYAELNYAPIALVDALCRQRCNILRAYGLLTEMEKARAAGDETAAQEKRRRHGALVREDIGVQEDFRQLLEGFSKMEPCYTRTSLTSREITDFISVTTAKIGKLRAYLALNHPDSPPTAKN
ncbi:MAG: hypothetical protein JWM88_2728 [Verrucomicrobia bacterium]|nr:hypothetical protein [Verrucomicrobiota bacterium]